MEFEDSLQKAGFEVLTAASMKMAVLWVVAPCSLVEVYRRFALMVGTASTSETSVNFYQTHCATTQKAAIFIHDNVHMNPPLDPMRQTNPVHTLAPSLHLIRCIILSSTPMSLK
jgi:hypothetical protein